jgi:hypothetical protein
MSPAVADRRTSSVDTADADADDVGSLHGSQRFFAVVGLVTLLCFAVGSSTETMFEDPSKKNRGNAVSTKFVTSRGGGDSSSTRSRRTNRTNATFWYGSNHHPKGRPSEPPRVVVPSSLTPWQTPKNLCGRRQIADGQWLPEHLKDGPPYLFPSNETRCEGPVGRYYSKRGWDTYRWVPNDSVAASSDSTTNNGNGTASSCHFTTWNQTMFCALAKHATVLIMGDSLSWEHYVSLALLLGASPVHHGYQHMSLLRDVNVGHAVCDGHARIVYRRDDDLSKVRNAVLEGGGESSNGTIRIPQVLVLNRGAHYVSDTELLAGIRSTLDVVEEWLGRCDQLNIKCHFFWRTTVPGHPRCHDSFKGPVNDLAAMEAYVANLSLYTPRELEFHWHDFRRQNELVEAELERRRAHLPHYRMLDGYRINLLRPDAHLRTGCLHNCYPGKMDVYSQLLLHYLKGDRTAADVERLRTVHEELGWDLNVTTVYDARDPAAG